jgi:hypothetical protein
LRAMPTPSKRSPLFSNWRQNVPQGIESGSHPAVVARAVPDRIGRRRGAELIEPRSSLLAHRTVLGQLAMK